MEQSMRKTKIATLVVSLVVLATASLPAFAKNWVQIGDGHYIDVDSIKPSSNYGSYTFDTKYLARNGVPLEVINGRKVWTVKTRSYIDCKSAYGKTISYSALDADDRTIVLGSNIYKQWLNIGKSGRASESYNFVCTDRYLDVRPGYHAIWWY